MVLGLPKIIFSRVCQGCILGKHPEHKYERVSHERTPAPLVLIHIDIFGPFPHMSMSEIKYVLKFIDEFSKYYWVYFLKLKSKVFDHFKVLKPWLRNSLGGNSRSSDMIMVVNMSSLSSLNIVKMQVSRCNTLFLTHLNRKALLRGRI